MTTKDLYTPPCAESFPVELEQPIAASYNTQDGTEIIGTDNPYDL